MKKIDHILDYIVKTEQNNHPIALSQIPNIDLYMDQVTTFADGVLGSYKRADDDKVLTKTMINNYTKDKLLLPPIKKKYTKRHMIMLILIYHLKSIFSINDVKILTNVLNKYSNEELEMFYENFFRLQECSDKSFAEVSPDFSWGELSENANEGVPAKYEELLELLLVLKLVLEANEKKRAAESIIDSRVSEDV